MTMSYRGTTVILLTIIILGSAYLGFLLIQNPAVVVKTPSPNTEADEVNLTAITPANVTKTTADTGVGKISGTLEGPVVVNITQMPP
jgi:hypothetical protein